VFDLSMDYQAQLHRDRMIELAQEYRLHHAAKNRRPHLWQRLTIRLRTFNGSIQLNALTQG